MKGTRLPLFLSLRRLNLSTNPSVLLPLFPVLSMPRPPLLPRLSPRHPVSRGGHERRMVPKRRCRNFVGEPAR